MPTFPLSDQFDVSQRIPRSAVEEAAKQMALSALKGGESVREAVSAMKAAVRAHNATFSVPVSAQPSKPDVVIPDGLLPRLLAVATRKETAKAKRRASAEHVSEQDALCSILVKAAGQYSLQKFIEHRKTQRETDKTTTKNSASA
jgi:hypothetical protein